MGLIITKIANKANCCITISIDEKINGYYLYQEGLEKQAVDTIFEKNRVKTVTTSIFVANSGQLSEAILKKFLNLS